MINKRRIKMEHFDNVNKVAFKDLTPEQMSCTMKAISDGNAEFYKDDKWRIIITRSVVFLNDSYRTIPKPVKKLNIPWAVLHFQWKYATLDCFGVYLWTEKPYFTKECGWIKAGIESRSVCDMFDIDVEGVEHETSLTKRPE